MLFERFALLVTKNAVDQRDDLQDAAVLLLDANKRFENLIVISDRLTIFIVIIIFIFVF